MESKKVAVIGAGSSGLAAIKCCKEEGIEVVCFERTGDVGGLWRYHDDDEDGRPSVMKTTFINTSKELSAFSDFPPPKEFPNYMHHTDMLKYFEMYAEHFGLYEHIRFYTEVVRVQPAEDYDDTGRWRLTSRDLKTDIEVTEVFDGVMVCTGHHAHPRTPKFPGQEKFRGRIMHTHSLKTNASFEDLTVVVVGIGNSALDAVADISLVARKVYLSTRRGGWVVSKAGPKGLPNDGMNNNRLYNTLFKIIGWRWYSRLAEMVIYEHFDHKFYGLKPKHRLFSQHPSVNDYLATRLMNGSVVIKKDIVTFTEDGVIFEGEKGATTVDAVVLATGYSLKFPFLPENLIMPVDNEVSLYKFAFPAHLKHPSLVFVGLIQPLGCIFPIAENQCRWYAQLMSGRVHLPSPAAMEADIRKTKAYLSERYVSSPRHTLQVDYLPFMDDIAGQYGAKPKLSKYFFTDRKLFWACLLYPCMAYQYRIEGPHPWSGARETILNYPERVAYPLTGGKTRFRERYFYPHYYGILVLVLVVALSLLLFLTYASIRCFLF